MKKYIYLVVLLFAMITGCKKSYLDINQNPNSATEESITPDLILPQALHTTAAFYGAGGAPIARWMGYWTRGGDYGPNGEEESYKVTTGFGTGNFSTTYNNGFDYHVMEQKANASGQKMYEAIAKTMKTVDFMFLVDIYNNVPYTKAFDLVGNIQPAYDKGSDIYKDLFKQLDQALVLIDEENGQSAKIITADIMFKGNKTSWKKFINTQRLKLLMHLSETTGIVDRNVELAKITPEGFLGSGETAAVNPPYQQADNQQNPFWNTYEKNVLGALVDKFNRANNYVLNTFKNTNDIRYQYYFDPAVSPLPGLTYFGYDYGFQDPDPDNPKSDNSSGVGGPGLARSPSQPQWLYTSVESLFLQAEAAQRGWAIPATVAGYVTDPRTAYENAVRESFIWLGVTNATTVANNYLGESFASWTAAQNPDKLKLIMTQKYLGLVGINNNEAWVDYRRLNTPAGIGAYPQVPKSLNGDVGPNIPLRLKYPQSEFDYNGKNVGAENINDVFTQKIFWDVN